MQENVRKLSENDVQVVLPPIIVLDEYWSIPIFRDMRIVIRRNEDDDGREVERDR